MTLHVDDISNLFVFAIHASYLVVVCIDVMIYVFVTTVIYNRARLVATLD
jgi:hypothetical protein